MDFVTLKSIQQLLLTPPLQLVNVDACIGWPGHVCSNWGMLVLELLC